MTRMGIGALFLRALRALWWRRWTALCLTVAWLALDGLLLGYLKVFQPTFGLSLLQWYRTLTLDDWIGPAVPVFLVSLLWEFFHDAIRAVFAVVFLRTLLAPAPGGQRQPTGLVGPFLLIFLFEAIWTVLFFPPDYVMLQMVTNRSIDVAADPILAVLIKAGLFILYALAMSRFCFAYPSAVIGTGLRPVQSWRQTKGLAMRLFLIFLVIPVPLVVSSNLAAVVTFSFGVTAESVRHQVFALQVIDSAAFVVEGVLTLAVIAVAYVAATGYSAAAIPGIQRTSVELARAFD